MSRRTLGMLFVLECAIGVALVGLRTSRPAAPTLNLERMPQLTASDLEDLGLRPQGVEIDVNALLGQQPPRFLEYRQGFEPEEVELHQACRLDIFHVELSDRHVRSWVAIEWH